MSLTNQLGRFLRAALFSNDETASRTGGVLAQQSYVSDVITFLNAGIWPLSIGDSRGDHEFTANGTLPHVAVYDNLTINSGVTVETGAGGCVLIVRDTLTNNGTLSAREKGGVDLTTSVHVDAIDNLPEWAWSATLQYPAQVAGIAQYAIRYGFGDNGSGEGFGAGPSSGTKFLYTGHKSGSGNGALPSVGGGLLLVFARRLAGNGTYTASGLDAIATAHVSSSRVGSGGGIVAVCYESGSAPTVEAEGGSSASHPGSGTSQGSGSRGTAIAFDISGEGLRIG